MTGKLGISKSHNGRSLIADAWLCLRAFRRKAAGWSEGEEGLDNRG